MSKKSLKSILGIILSAMMALSLSTQPIITLADDVDSNSDYGYVAVDKDSLLTYKVFEGTNEYTGYTYNGHSFVPVSIFNNLHIPDANISVIYIPDTKKVTVIIEGYDTKEGFTRTLLITPADETTKPTVVTSITLDGDTRTISSPMAVLNIDGSLYIPKSVLTEGLILETLWNPTNADLTITGETNELSDSDSYYEGNIITGFEPIKIPDIDDIEASGEGLIPELNGLDLDDFTIPMEGGSDILANDLLGQLDITMEDLESVDLSEIDWDYYLGVIQDEDALRSLLDGCISEDQINLLIQACQGIMGSSGSDSNSIGGAVYSTIEDMLGVNVDSMISDTNTDIQNIYDNISKGNSSN